MVDATLKERVLSLVSADEKAYFDDCFTKIHSAYHTHFIRIFSTINRHLSIATKSILISIPEDEQNDLIVDHWEISKVIRVLFLQHIQENDPAKYFQFVDNLFNYGDIDELIALYASLNTLQYPDMWVARCAEGIRNNIEGVQQAVMLHNKYPFNHLDDMAWNQLVLKSFFTNKNTAAIYGITQRMNDQLADAVIDYIFERDAAKRPINPMLWIFAKSRLNDRSINILLNRFQHEESDLARSIMLYAINQSNNQQAIAFYNNEFPKGQYVTSLEEIITELNG